MQAGRGLRAGLRDVQVSMELVEGVLQVRVFADTGPDLDRFTGRCLDKVAVTRDILQVRISEGKLETPKQHCGGSPFRRSRPLPPRARSLSRH
jgi:hypothetical protein